MINITIERENGYIRAFKVEGHAGYAEHGKDIVCAAVSAVTIGFANLFIESGYMHESIMENGLLHFRLMKNYEQADTMMLMFAMTRILKQIQGTHPDYITIKEVEYAHES